jgi:predicted ATP-grasp superfamily ATP-dependent carboligase
LHDAVQTAFQQDIRGAAMVISVLFTRLSLATDMSEVNDAAREAQEELKSLGQEIEALERANCGIPPSSGPKPV